MFIYPFEKAPWEMPLGYEGLKRAVDLMEFAIQKEKDDVEFYNVLIELAPTEEEKVMLTTIRDDELKHGRMYRKMYREITGEEAQVSDQVQLELPKTYVEGIIEAIFHEFDALDKYNTIQYGLQSELYQDMLLEIRADEFKHGSTLNYLYTLNKVKN